MARPERFELPTYSSGGCRSIQLSYGRAPFSLHAGSGAIKCAGHGNPMSPDGAVFRAEDLPAIAATTAAAFASAASASPTAASAFRLGARFVHVQGASADLRAVESRDRLISFLGVRHLDKAKTTRAARVAVGHDADPIYLSV